MASDQTRPFVRLPSRPVKSAGNTSRSNAKLLQITLEDRYDPPANFLEIEVNNPETHGFAGKRYTDYEIRMKVRLLSLVSRLANGFPFVCRRIYRCFD